MFISKLSGGLGNQLFQYAAGRSISLMNKTSLMLDLSFYSNSPNRKFILSEFKIMAMVASPKEVYKILGESKNYILDKLTGKKRINKDHSSVYKEKYFHFDPIVLQLKPPVMLDGYWQSSKYFSAFSDTIRQELAFKNTLQFENSNMLLQIKNSNAVAIHLRRGDYLANPEINAIHGVCTHEYYMEAASIIKQKINDPVYFVFSDNVKEADELIPKLGGGVNVSKETTYNQFLDFYLMQQCKHIVMANSSFSWWAAWLNENKDKLVVAPKNWFRNLGIITTDLYEDSWIVI